MKATLFLLQNCSKVITYGDEQYMKGEIIQNFNWLNIDSEMFELYCRTIFYSKFSSPYQTITYDQNKIIIDKETFTCSVDLDTNRINFEEPYLQYILELNYIKNKYSSIHIEPMGICLFGLITTTII